MICKYWSFNTFYKLRSSIEILLKILIITWESISFSCKDVEIQRQPQICMVVYRLNKWRSLPVAYHLKYNFGTSPFHHIFVALTDDWCLLVKVTHLLYFVNRIHILLTPVFGMHIQCERLKRNKLFCNVKIKIPIYL